jgi:ABC-type uncharacterized transport system involved in gliding motility auxiliary subunit
MRQLYQQMGRPLPQGEDPYEALERLLRAEKYQVRRVDLTRESPLPADATTIIVMHPRSLSSRQQWELNRALHEGKAVLLAVQMHRWSYNLVRKAVSVTRQDEHPQVNPWLTQYGIEIDGNILMDVNHQSLTIRQTNDPLAALLGSGITLNLPLHITLPQEVMNRQVSITSHLAPLFYLWGSALKLRGETLQQHQLQHTVLFTTSPKAWLVSADAQLSAASLQPPSSGGQQYPLAILVQGQFPDVYSDTPRPPWPPPPVPQGTPAPAAAPEEAPAAPPHPAPGKLLVIGNAQMFHRGFLTGGNLDLFMNSVDALTLGDDMIHIRSKKPINRTISKPSAATRQFWKFVNLGLVNLAIAMVGVGSAIIRQRARLAYTTSQLL